jgi:hypothetical protein
MMRPQAIGMHPFTPDEKQILFKGLPGENVLNEVRPV